MATRRALLIGINRYQYVIDLKGCENDVRDLQEVLQTQFAFADIRTLLSEQATGQAMRAAFAQLVDDAVADDVVLIYFAGHGSQMRDSDGDEQSGFDNTLMPYDSKHDPANPELNTDLLDDELAEVMEALTGKTKNVTVIVDACHSGTVLREAPDVSEPVIRPIVTRERGAPRYDGPLPERVKSRLRFTPTARAHASYAFIASCRDDQKAKEIAWPQPDGTVRHHGGFSYYFIARLRKLTSTPTLRELFEGAAAELFDVLGHRQHPQLEGRVDRRLFGLETDPPMRHLRLRSVPDETGRVVLAGGTALGLGVGARVAVYPPGTLRVTDTPPLARGTVIDVRAVECTVQLDVDAAGPVISSTSRVVVEHAGPSRLTRPVVLAPLPTGALTDVERSHVQAQFDALRTLLANDAHMRLRDEAAPDALVVELWTDATTADRWRWAITAGDGVPLGPLLPLDATNAVYHNCTVLTRQWLVAQLANGRGASALRGGTVSAKLLTAERAAKTFSIAPDGAAGLPVVRHADMPLALRINNGHGKGVFVSLLECYLDGTIRQTFPPNGARSETALKPTEAFEIFAKRGQRRGYSLPDHYPWVADGAFPAREEGVATLYLFVAEQPVDVGFLCTEAALITGTLPPEASRSSWSEFPGIVLPANASSPSEASTTPDTDWTAIDVRFQVRREPTSATPGSS